MILSLFLSTVFKGSFLFFFFFCGVSPLFFLKLSTNSVD